MKFEDRSHEETERRQRCARSKAWNLAKNKYKLKEKDKATFYSPAEEWVLLAASIKEPEEREFVVDSRAIELWRLKDDHRNKIWALSTLVWRYVEEQDERRWEATIKDFNFLLTRQDKKFFSFRALQGHSGRNSIDPSLQDNVLIPNNFFDYIYHFGCAVNLHSITNSGLIAGGQNSSRDRQAVFFTAVNPMHKNHQDPKELDLTKPRLASYQKNGKRIKTRCTGRHTVCSAERIEFSIKQGRTQSSYTIHSQLVVSRRRLWWTLEKSYTRKRMCHFDHHREFLTKIIGRAIWGILMLLEAATTSNESN